MLFQIKLPNVLGLVVKFYARFGKNFMSRIGKMEIQIPEAVNISLGSGVVDIKGPKGNIVVPFHQD